MLWKIHGMCPASFLELLLAMRSPTGMRMPPCTTQPKTLKCRTLLPCIVQSFWRRWPQAPRSLKPRSLKPRSHLQALPVNRWWSYASIRPPTWHGLGCNQVHQPLTATRRSSSFPGHYTSLALATTCDESCPWCWAFKPVVEADTVSYDTVIKACADANPHGKNFMKKAFINNNNHNNKTLML